MTADDDLDQTPPAPAHPHEAVAGVPDRLPAAELRALSTLEPAKALAAIGLEWLGIAAAAGLYLWRPGVLTYLVAVVFIGARQHALTVIGHDASHYRLLPTKRSNDLVANLFLMWPIFISAGGFRHFHSPHHRYFGGPEDGNRSLWKTHNAIGELAPEWVYPKTPAALVAKILRHMAFATGIRWIIRGLLGMFVIREPLGWKLGRNLFYVLAAATLTLGGWWLEFLLVWIVPLCTWHVAIQYMRLIAEHSVVASEDPDYQGTRTTLPTRLEALLILPRNIGYHLEHHWYPSVPFYKLPALHQRLMEEPRFRAHADISPSLLRSLVQVTRR